MKGYHDADHRESESSPTRRSLFAAFLVLALSIGGASPVAAAPEGRADAPAGQVTWAVHVSLAPTWFDPAETSGIITPFLILYALHDAMVKTAAHSGVGPRAEESGLGSTTFPTYRCFGFLPKRPSIPESSPSIRFLGRSRAITHTWSSSS